MENENTSENTLCEGTKLFRELYVKLEKIDEHNAKDMEIFNSADGSDSADTIISNQNSNFENVGSTLGLPAIKVKQEKVITQIINNLSTSGFKKTKRLSELISDVPNMNHEKSNGRDESLAVTIKPAKLDKSLTHCADTTNDNIPLNIPNSINKSNNTLSWSSISSKFKHTLSKISDSRYESSDHSTSNNNKGLFQSHLHTNTTLQSDKSTTQYAKILSSISARESRCNGSIPINTNMPKRRQSKGSSGARASSKPPSNKMSGSNYGNTDNYPPFNGAAFLHTQLRTNTALQSILEDIISLNNEYKCTEDNLLDDEIDELRKKNDLPSLKVMESSLFAEEFDFGEYSSGEFDDYVKSDESQRRESIIEIEKERVEVVDIDDDSNQLIIDEAEDELAFKKRKFTKEISINGTVVEIDRQTPECPLCAKMFKSIIPLQEHLQLCIGPKSVCSENDSNGNNGSINSNIGEVSSLGGVENVKKDEPVSKLKIGEVFSIKQEKIKCWAIYCSFEGTEDELKQHVRVHLATRKFRRLCKDCNITFFDIPSLETHFKATGHTDVFSPLGCPLCDFIYFSPREYSKHVAQKHTKLKPSEEIIEIGDD